MTNKKKDIVYLTIGIATLIALITGATYAYFQAQSKNGTNSSVDITSGTTDHLVFTTDGNISISASADNFKENGQDLSETATAKAILTANNTTHIANDTYNVYLDITSNNLEYSSYQKESDTKIYLKQEVKEEDITNGVLDSYTPIPELYLKVDGPKSFSKEIKGFTLDSEGYDITEKRGLITIAEDVPISTTAPEGMTTDTWTITITFKNLKTNQQLNTGKELKGKIIIQKEKLVLSKLLADSNKEGKEPTLLYHDGQKDYTKEINYALEAEDYSYRYSGGNNVVNNYICFGGDCSNDSTKDNYKYLYRIIGLFDDDKDGIYNMKLIKADYPTEEELGTNGNYEGKYIEVASSASYTTDYIGDKNTYLPKVAAFKWHKQNTLNDTWETSELNIVNLNDYFLNTFIGSGNNIEVNPNVWQQMIEKYTWVIGGNIAQNLIFNYNTKISYLYEIVNTSDNSKKYNGYIGLFYLNEYRYAASEKFWTSVGNDMISSGENTDYRTSINDNWMHVGLQEWSLTISTDVSQACRIDPGCLGGGDKTSVHAIRPTFYLKTNVKIIDGNGTFSNPYRLSL